RKFGSYAIHNLSLIIIIGYVIGYIIQFLAPELMNLLTLNPYYIMKGQIWRIVTWVIKPPSEFGLFTIIMLFFYYSIGNDLERTWGAFRYNVYIFSGILFSVIGAILLFLFQSAFSISSGDAHIIGMNISYFFTTYYINLSIFLAFAASYPDMRVLLYFIIPIKIKWLAYLDIALLLVSFVFGNASSRVAIIASLLNFIVFFFATKNLKRITPREIRRKTAYRKSVANATCITKHKCAICGRTEEDDPTLEFRFCSKCDGNYEYCQDHLYSHEHVHK
ncbi:MAG: hypothetical protein GX567_05950, partial [Clostridia bacterium]|nr:hypothetical protein [Clostridia bacterium]